MFEIIRTAQQTGAKSDECRPTKLSACIPCINLGYPQTAHWIEENLGGVFGGVYGAGVVRGFVAQETGACFVPTCYPIGIH